MSANTVASDLNPEGVLRFYLDIRIDAREMRAWPPQCLTAFFDGLARAVEAAEIAREAIRQEQAAKAALGALKGP